MKKRIFLILFVILLIFAPLLSACNHNEEEHLINVTSSNIRLGSVEGYGTYKTDKKVVLKAISKNENRFVAWIKDNNIVSTDSEFEFKASTKTEGKYIAVFYSNSSDYLFLEKIQLIANTTDDEIYDLSEIVLKMSNIEIFKNLKYNSTFEKNQNGTIFEENISSNLVFNKNEEAFGNIVTKINSSVNVTNLLFKFGNEIEKEINLSCNLETVSLNLKLYFKPLGYVAE